MPKNALKLKQRVLSQGAWLNALNGNTQLSIPLCGHRVIRKPWNARRDGRVENLLYFVETGSIKGFIQKTPVHIEAGAALWIAPGIPHYLETDKLPWTLFNLRTRLIHKGFDLRLHPPFLIVKNAWNLRPVMQQLFDEVSFPSSYHDQKIRWIMSLLMSGVFDLLSKPETEDRTLNNAQRLLITQHIQEHITQRISSAHLAAKLGLSRNYFSELFRHTFETSPRKWIKQERIRIAAQHLIDSTLNISEVANHMGYDDIFLFSRQFKHVMGCSPKAYREKH
jgi:AraC-like DNA-binding protein